MLRIAFQSSIEGRGRSRLICVASKNEIYGGKSGVFCSIRVGLGADGMWKRA